MSRPWVYALKPASWPKLLVPMLLGHAMGFAAAGGAPRPLGIVFGTLFTVCDLSYLVLLNDWFDRDVDALKRRLFPNSGSPKTIPDAILPARSVLFGGLVAGALAIGLGAVVASSLGLGVFIATLVCLFIFTAYSIPPLRLNYRGGGELLEMLGVGAALPWLVAYAVSGEIFSARFVAIPGFVVLSLSSAIASGLSDEESDRQGGKRTVVTRFGNRFARRAVEILVLAGAAVWIVTAVALPAELPFFAVAPAVGVVLGCFVRLRRASAHAVTNAFAAQGKYKLELHRAIWGSATLLALLLFLASH